MATRLGGKTLVEYQSNPHVFSICMWNIVWNMKHKNASKAHIYMRNIVWNIIFIKFHRNTYIYMRNIAWNIQIAYGIFKKSTKLIRRNHTYIYEEHRMEYHVFAKSFQKSSKNVQPRNSSVEYLWNVFF